jgi:hypothetical protein
MIRVLGSNKKNYENKAINFSKHHGISLFFQLPRKRG